LPTKKKKGFFGPFEAIKSKLEKTILELAPQALPKIVLLPKVIFLCNIVN